MPKYRVKSGVVRLKGKGNKEVPVGVNGVVNLTPETATKFKEHLTPISPDAIFVDEFDEYSEIASREMTMKMVPVEGEKGFYNVINTITGNYVNAAPLTGKAAMDLIKGTNVSPEFDEYKEKGISSDEEIDEDIDEDTDDEKEVKVKKKKKSSKKDKEKTDKKKKKKKKSEE